MANYKEMYYELFNDISEVIKILMKAQIKSEEKFANRKNGYNNNMLNENKEKYLDD